MNKIFIIGTLVATSILAIAATTTLVGTAVEKSNSELDVTESGHGSCRR